MPVIEVSAEQLKKEQDLRSIKDYVSAKNITQILDDAINEVVVSKPQNCFGIIVKHVGKFEDGPTIMAVELGTIENLAGLKSTRVSIRGCFRGDEIPTLAQIVVNKDLSAPKEIAALNTALSSKLVNTRQALDTILRTILEANKELAFAISLAATTAFTKGRNPYETINLDAIPSNSLKVVIPVLSEISGSVTEVALLLDMDKTKFSRQDIQKKMLLFETCFVKAISKRSSTGASKDKKAKKEGVPIEICASATPPFSYRLSDGVVLTTEDILDVFQECLKESKAQDCFSVAVKVMSGSNVEELKSLAESGVTIFSAEADMKEGTIAEISLPQVHTVTDLLSKLAPGGAINLSESAIRPRLLFELASKLPNVQYVKIANVFKNDEHLSAFDTLLPKL